VFNLSGRTAGLGGVVAASALLIFFFQNCSIQKMTSPLDLDSTALTSNNSFSAEPTFTEISEQILKPNCVSCHSSGTINYTSYEAVMASNSVVPGDANSSKLYIEVSDGMMPKGGPLLPPTDIEAIRAWIAAGAKNDSAGTLPSPLQNLMASVLNPNQINLNWTLGSANTTAIVIERSTSAATGPFTVIANLASALTNYSDTGLTPMTKYYYRVAAKNVYGQAAYSNVVTVSTSDFAPMAPSNLATSAIMQTQLTLTWTDNSGDETEFRIEKSTNSAGPFTATQTVAANTVSVVISGLNASTLYYFRVAAYSVNGGISTYSNVVGAQTLTMPSAPPVAPSGISATSLSSSQIKVAWTDNSADETGFKVERSTLSSGSYVVVFTSAASVTSYTDSGLSASTTYYYRVSAYNSSGSSAYTSMASATTGAPAVTAPSAPSSLAATANSSTQITISWMDNSTNETGFKIESSKSSSGPFAQIATVAAGVTTYVNSALTASTAYYYRVRAYNAVGDSAYSNVSSASTSGAAPNAPSGLAAQAVSTAQINLSWVDNSSNETQFKIERASAQTGPYTEIARTNSNVNSYSDVGLSTATTYYYRVSALNANGSSNVSNIISATTIATFTWVNANVIQPLCLSCHGGSSTKGNYDMSTYAKTMTRVVAGSSANSLMYQKIQDGSMPQGKTITTQQKNAVKTWIDSNAPNN
jgi:titin